MAETAPWETAAPTSEVAPWETAPWDEAEKPSYGVDIKSKKALAKNQYEMVKRAIETPGTDFYGLPDAVKKNMLRQAEEQASPVASTIKNTLKEIPRFGAEMVNMAGQGAYRTADYLGSLATVAKGVLPGQNFDENLHRAAYQQKNYVAPPPLIPVEESSSGRVIGTGVNYAKAGLREIGKGYAGLGALATGDNAVEAERYMNSPEVSDTLGRLEGVGDTVMGVAAGYPMAKGVSKGVAAVPKGVEYAKDVAPKVAAKVSEVVSPKSKAPLGTIPDIEVLPDDFAQRKMNSSSPKVVENQAANAHDTLATLDRSSVDSADLSKLRGKAYEGLSELEQQAAEGRIHEFDQSGNVVTDAQGQPVPYKPGKGGVLAAIKPIRQMLKNIWDSEYVPQLEKAAQEGYGVKVNFKGEQLDPIQAQAKISELNEIIEKGKGATAVEDTIKIRELKKEASALREALDTAVDKTFGNMKAPELRQRYGAGRYLEELVMNGAETKLVKGKAVENPSAAGTAANVAGGIGIGLLYHNPVIGAALTVPKLGRVAYKAYNKWKSNPDTAFATLIRAGRTRGNTTRPTYSPEVTAPEPYSPTPRGMSGGQPSPVVDPLIGRPVTGGTEVVPRGMSGGQPSPLPQTLVPDGPMTKGSPTSTISTGTAPAEAPYQGIAEPFGKEILDNQNGGLSLKQQVKEAGGGKKGVADVAKKLGVPAVVLATWLLADEDKKKELAMLPAFAVFGMLREVKNPNYVGGKTVTISTNPGRAEIYRFLNDTKKAQLETGWTQHPFAGDNSLRYIIDEKTGDIHFAPADIMTHDMIADSTGVKDIAYRGFVKTPATLDSMFNDPWIKDATKGKFGGKIKEKIDQLKLKFDKEVSNG